MNFPCSLSGFFLRNISRKKTELSMIRVESIYWFKCIFNKKYVSWFHRIHQFYCMNKMSIPVFMYISNPQYCSDKWIIFSYVYGVKHLLNDVHTLIPPLFVQEQQQQELQLARTCTIYNFELLSWRMYHIISEFACAHSIILYTYSVCFLTLSLYSSSYTWCFCNFTFLHSANETKRDRMERIIQFAMNKNELSNITKI